jgi:FkbM family methyltransferase
MTYPSEYFSQNNEQNLIQQYFGGNTGTLFDIGAADGITFSNSRRFLLDGWKGFLVEPGKNSYAKLNNLYATREDIKTFNFGIGNKNEFKEFYEASYFPFDVEQGVSTYSSVGDRENCGLNGTFKKEYHEFFSNNGVKYDNTYLTEIVTFNQFHALTNYSKCDLLLLDTSGSYDYEILEQINFKQLGVQFFITAWSWKDTPDPDEEHKYIKLAETNGFKLLEMNDDNLIFGK